MISQEQLDVITYTLILRMETEYYIGYDEKTQAERLVWPGERGPCQNIAFSHMVDVKDFDSSPNQHIADIIDEGWKQISTKIDKFLLHPGDLTAGRLRVIDKLQVFDDPHVAKMRMAGVYGWLELGMPQFNPQLQYFKTDYDGKTKNFYEGRS